MTAIIILLCVLLISIVLVQIGRVTELTAQIKGEQETLADNSKWNAWLSLGFVVVFLPAVVLSAAYYRPYMLGYGPHEAASIHGKIIDNAINITLFFTGIVFVLTQIALFYFAYKYRWRQNRKAIFLAHNNRLEVWWTAIPAVVMTFLVVNGLNAWNTIMADVREDEDFIEIEATGQQFNWIMRMPGPDGKLGTRDYKLTTGANPLGMDFTDQKGWDDIVPTQEIYLPVGKKIRVRITAKDVLHNFYLPQHRVKMDAVPGMPTYFVFTPDKTTTEYRNALRQYPEYNEPYDAADPTGPKKWEKFDYELACAELCGNGHYAMRRIIKIVSQEEFDRWYAAQTSFYQTEIRGKEGDPNMGKTLAPEVGTRAQEFGDAVKKAVESSNPADKTMTLNNVGFEAGAATLTADSRYELDNLVKAMTDNAQLSITVTGPADDPAQSQARADAVARYLVDRGVAAARIRTAAGTGDAKTTQVTIQ